ncbi:hypothetical protein J4050_05750 [Winogradskyella sp. DF17]|uniref:Uncharacterized protein n=1 Tax=Winogradskyella pelagia TaxID=2819984 RepID=A0ABS3T0H5_9FLAO|nr:hypothetical protein [Winogradskyella sp. DF17]MBO3116242.1 hypothetical protein [Winogradskyella sp. DF17]
MKTNILKVMSLLILLSYFGCKDCEDIETQLNSKTVELRQAKDSIISLAATLEQCQIIASKEYGTILLNPYKPIQKLIEMTDAEKKTYGKSHFKIESIDFNMFNTEKGEIHLKFPVYNPSGTSMEIMDIINASSEDLNAIVVLVDGFDGEKNRASDATHFIEAKAQIKRIKGLSKAMLADHEQLKVYILHDTAFYSDKLIDGFRACVKSDGAEYEANICRLPPPVLILDINRPREQEGDIIVGG